MIARLQHSHSQFYCSIIDTAWTRLGDRGSSYLGIEDRPVHVVSCQVPEQQQQAQNNWAPKEGLVQPDSIKSLSDGCIACDDACQGPSHPKQLYAAADDTCRVRYDYDAAVSLNRFSWLVFGHEVTPRHNSTDFGVDMGGKRLHGYSTLNLTCLESGTDTVVLDTRGLKILAVELLRHPNLAAAQLLWELGEVSSVLGQALVATLPGICQQGDTLSVGVSFEVDEASSAVQFLAPQQTSGKKHPFMFTQCQAIHARALVPCQVPSASPAADHNATGLGCACLLSLPTVPQEAHAGHTQRQDDLLCDGGRPAASQSVDERPDGRAWPRREPVPLLR